MKTPLMLLLVLWAALTAEGAPAEAAVEQEDPSASGTEEEADPARPSAHPGTLLNLCLEGWRYRQGSCYRLFNSPGTWRDGERHCGEFDGSLASIHDIWEHKFLQGLAETAGHSFVWVGGYYFESDWRWEDGSRFDYYKGNFIGGGIYQRCLQLSSDGRSSWSNQACYIRLPYICKKTLGC